MYVTLNAMHASVIVGVPIALIGRSPFRQLVGAVWSCSMYNKLVELCMLLQESQQFAAGLNRLSCSSIQQVYISTMQLM